LTEGASLSQLADTVGSLGGRVLATLELSDSLLVELPIGVRAPAGSAEIPDTPMKVNGTQQYYKTTVPTYRETIGVPEGSRLGDGVTVALVDTGVSAQADGLQANVEHVNVSDGANGDGLGHGTFLAGLIAGTGTHQGVAPGARILDVQVADEKGNTSLWKVLEGLNVAGKAGVDVVNLSLSTDSPLPPSFDPLSRTLERLWDELGVTVVVAAGNDGPGWGTVASPGNTPTVITVGALDEKATPAPGDDTVAEFSARGTLYDAMKPDLVAPGVSLVSTAAPGSIAVKRNKDSLVGDGYMRGSGTSMSAAVVSGAVAALLSEKEGLTPDTVKAHLEKTARSSDDLQNTDGAGAGALDLGKALSTEVVAAVQAPPEVVPGEFGPDERDAERWAAFAALWAANDDSPEAEAQLKAAWQALSPRTKIWAARAWSMAVVANSLGEGREEFEARAWSARAWSAEEWLARAWSARAWSARAWSDEEWLARAWSARAWSDEEWLARAWSARAWSDSDWAARAWSARAWSARAWSARAWSARAWSARAWSARAWSARAWSARAWSARAWSDYTWQARAWSARAWSDDAWSLDPQ
jgi:serine protease AprX